MTLKNTMLAGAGILFVLVAVAAFKSPAGAWPMCVAGIALLVIAHFDRIVEISATATGAKIVLQQVQDKVVELRRLVMLTGKMNMAVVQRMGRWGTAFTHEEMEAIREGTESLMRDAGLSADEIREVRSREWDRYVYLDYVFWALDKAAVHKNKPGYETLIKIELPGTPDEVEAFLRSVDDLSDERKVRIDYYRHYVRTGNHQDPAAWQKRQDDN
jgi:hypothetical protein